MVDLSEGYPYRPLVRQPGERFPRGMWCVKCGAYQDEPARPKCKNKIWHSPDYNVFMRQQAAEG